MTGRNWRRIFALAGLAALAVSLAANGLLFSQLRERYALQLEQQVWPAGSAGAPRVSEPAEPGAPTVLLIGDSRVAQWPAPARLKVRWVNAGVSGLAAAQLPLRLPALLDEFQPKLIVVQCGINDLKLLGLRPGLAPSLAPQTAAHLQAVAESALARHSRVLLLEIWPASTPDLLRRAFWSPAIAVAVADVNSSLRRLEAPARGLRVLDLLSAAHVRPDSGAYRDTLHLTPATYEQLTPVLEREITSAMRD